MIIKGGENYNKHLAEILKKDSVLYMEKFHALEDVQSNYDGVQITYINQIFQERIDDLIKNSSWREFSQLQKLRFLSLEEKKLALIISPERKVGLGNFIEWTSRQFTAPGGCDGRVRIK